MTNPQAHLIIYVSTTGHEPWAPVLPSLVPAWIRDDPNVITVLMAGEMAQQRDFPLAWYKCEVIKEETQQ